MQWLLRLETDKDPIATCRLMNIFRRKGAAILRLELEARGDHFSLTALVETKESDVPHLFHFLRRTEGVREVACYRNEPAPAASSGTGAGGNGARGTGLPEINSRLLLHTSKEFDAL